MTVRFHRRRVVRGGEDPHQILVRVGPIKFNICWWKIGKHGPKFYWEG